MVVVVMVVVVVVVVGGGGGGGHEVIWDRVNQLPEIVPTNLRCSEVHLESSLNCESHVSQ